MFRGTAKSNHIQPGHGLTNWHVDFATTVWSSTLRNEQSRWQRWDISESLTSIVAVKSARLYLRETEEVYSIAKEPRPVFELLHGTPTRSPRFQASARLAPTVRATTGTDYTSDIFLSTRRIVRYNYVLALLISSTHRRTLTTGRRDAAIILCT